MNTKLCLAVAAADKDLAHDVLLDLLTTNCAVLLRVKCFGIACKIFFQTLAECDAEIGGVVHLAHTAGNALTDGIIRTPEVPCSTRGTETTLRISLRRSMSSFGVPL